MGIYMKYGIIKGDATQDGFEHWINVSGFTWQPAVTRDIKTNTGKGRNREQSQPHVSRISVDKAVDHASGPLYKSLVTVPKAVECKIAFLRTDEGGETYTEYTLTDTLLQHLTLRGDGRSGGRNVDSRLHQDKGLGEATQRGEYRLGAFPLRVQPGHRQGWLTRIAGARAVHHEAGVAMRYPLRIVTSAASTPSGAHARIAAGRSDCNRRERSSSSSEMSDDRWNTGSL